MVDPAKIHAVIVAIEKFDLGANWNLPGQADEAALFAEWLITKKQVKPENIHVFVSPLAADPFPARGIKPLGLATRDAIEKFLNGHFLTLAGDLLLFHWSGHGVATRSLSRRLYFADATPKFRVNLDVDQLVPLLRTGSFPSQLGFLNACASFHEALESPDLAPGGLMPAAQSDQRCDQNFFFAALPGQYASGEDAFAPAIRQLLVDSENFPPDPEALWSGIKKELDRRNQLTGFDQQPAWLEFNVNGTMRTRGVVPTHDQLQKIAARAGLPVYFLRELASAAAACPATAQLEYRDQLALKGMSRPRKEDRAMDMLRIVAAYAKADQLSELAEALRKPEESDEAIDFKHRVEQLSFVRDLAPKLAALQVPLDVALESYARVRSLRQERLSSIDEILDDLLRPGAGSTAPLIEFLERVSRASLWPAAQQDLADWLDQQASWAGTVKAVREKLHQASPPVRRYLIELNDSGAPARAWSLSGKSLHQVTSYDFSQYPLAESISRFIDQELVSGPLSIELLVPENLLIPARGAFSVGWRTRRVDPELKASISVRWRDRMTSRQDPLQYYFGTWLEAGKAIGDRRATRPPLNASWSNTGCEPAQLRQKIIAEAGIDFVGIRSKTLDDILELVCLAGISYGGWYRQNVDTPHAELEATLCALAANHPAIELPQRIVSRRTDPADPLHDLVLLWDDPGVNPLDNLKFHGTDQRA